MARLLGLLPSRLCSLASDLLALLCGHSLETALPADLTASTTDGGHILRGDGGTGDVAGRSRSFRLWCRYLACGNGDSPSGELIRVARAFAFADCHSIHIMPQMGC